MTHGIPPKPKETSKEQGPLPVPKTIKVLNIFLMILAVVMVILVLMNL